MISMLKGQVAHLGKADVTLMVAGVGYHVHMPAGIDRQLVLGDEVMLYTVLISRDDALNLYGFVAQRQREIFTLLLNVTGVGPRTAMNIIAGVEPNRFLEEVVSENVSYLCTLPGIGKKSAQRIVLDLKEKISKQYQCRGLPREGRAGEDALAALVSLGYSEREARRALNGLEADSVEDLIRQALKELM